MTKKICCLLALMLISGCTSATPPLEGQATLQFTAAPPTTAQLPNLTPTPASVPTMTPSASAVEWAGQSSGDPNPFNKPSGLALDAQGNLYVVDGGNARIQKFDPTGRFLTLWGSPGTGDGQFRFVEGRFGSVAVDAQGSVYVADVENGRVQKFDDQGHLLANWNRHGKADGEFLRPFTVAVDPQGNVYVTDIDPSTDRVQKFDSNGKFLLKWGGFGTADGQFLDFSALATDAQGNIYVADPNNLRVQKFDAKGNFVSKWSTCSPERPSMSPAGVATDTQRNVYITDIAGNRVCKFDREGRFLTSWGNHGQGDGQFSQLSLGIVVDKQGNVYVADPYNDRIEKFRQPSYRP